jgi:hypothetical protein
MPPSEATSQYPPPVGIVAIPTTGASKGLPPMEPSKAALPKVKMPPSEATSQYPPPVGVAAIPTIGASSAAPASEPSHVALPNAKTSPNWSTSQYPWPDGVVAAPTTRAFAGRTDEHTADCGLAAAADVGVTIEVPTAPRMPTPNARTATPRLMTAGAATRARSEAHRPRRACAEQNSPSACRCMATPPILAAACYPCCLLFSAFSQFTYPYGVSGVGRDVQWTT